MSTQVAERGLWRNRDFRLLWGGQSLSLIGSQITLVAMPLVAVTLLAASPAQLGVLSALERLPFVLILFVGVWVDRVRRRPLLIATDFARGALLASVPVLFLTDGLTLAWLCVVVVLVGICQVVFDVADLAYLPSLVDKDQLTDANSKVQLSMSVAQVAGPGLVALLLGWFSAAVVIVIDTVTYLASGIACLLIRHRETVPARPEGKREPVLRAIRDGVRFVWGQPLLRPTLLATAFFMFFWTGIQTLYYPYAYRELGVPASLIALILAAGAPAAMVGAALGPKLVDRIGLGRMLLISGIFGNGSFLLLPLATTPTWLAVVVLAFAQLLFGVGMPLGVIVTMTVRQAVTPDHLQGRVAATFRAFGLGLSPLGALAAGFAAEPLGMRATIAVCAVGMLIPLVFQFLSPLVRLREVPETAQVQA
ncbi:MFS transporter [Actinokineospora diospyrosa]|uniref:Arabinose efflux permease, MFS family n=1 Tax=Actinokineospora diospyrosa TaxID=103728 RepID=A0ABT1I613_9PSEU|nr:MFS transporter [Actinokineospora diospyrosa]MCP2268009.1 putative arabinose efflux permease, MFS family [Actinokineospora diospyrosa]